jgi:hypothetical protein
LVNGPNILLTDKIRKQIVELVQKADYKSNRNFERGEKGRGRVSPD